MLPSVVLSSSLISLKVRDSLAARALTIPSRIRSWIRLSSSGAFSAARMASMARAAPRGRATFPGCPCCPCCMPERAVCLATVPPCDDGSENNMKSPKPGSHEEISPTDRREDRHRPQRHETDTHHRHDLDGERTASHYSCAIEQEPHSGEHTIGASMAQPN